MDYVGLKNKSVVAIFVFSSHILIIIRQSCCNHCPDEFRDNFLSFT